MSEQWSQGAGEIPAQPEPTVDPRMQAVPEQPHFPYQPQPSVEILTAPIGTPSQNGIVHKTRAEVREMRRREREEGVQFPLKHTGIYARVRDLPFADRMMLMGIPDDMRDSIAKAIGQIQQMSGMPGLAAALKFVNDQAALDDGICIAGFIQPRLVATEAEADAANSDDVWWVGDLHPEEREAYRDFVMRDRNGSQEDVARLAQFPGSGVVQAGSR